MSVGSGTALAMIVIQATNCGTQLNLLSSGDPAGSVRSVGRLADGQPDDKHQMILLCEKYVCGTVVNLARVSLNREIYFGTKSGAKV